MIIILRRASLLLACLAGPLAAQDLPLPEAAEETVSLTEAGVSYALPSGPWTADSGLPALRVDGTLSLRAWRIDDSAATPADLMGPIRESLEGSDYEILLDCAAARCGGFDFRFATRVAPAPGMYVDLTDYRFLSARKGDRAISVLTSRSAAAGFVQSIQISENETPSGGIVTTRAGTSAPDVATGDLIARLEAQGHVPLEDVTFASGDTSLGQDGIASLDTLARYLADTPDRRILLVGHTDAEGSLAGNRDLSLARARSVAAYLREAGAPADQVAAEGVGYLAPRASNLSPEGRALNRRVEAVLLARE
ncbi:OmpA family protein [Roseivivax sp. THAF30]|uniref:OmpA family protein n=1 Tax=Roseivivax sp. THAF30 TaxID=2587852 RepID=UPI0012683BE2|nr:OmpA family protein [Roseivivax sp. THAF30]QFT61600.1 Peptidoglycan-binding protein ArfA [Roseivivax sp. THAF30]